MKRMIEHLKRQDEKLAPVIDEVGKLTRRRNRGTAFEILCRSIVGQQLSTKAAHSIYSRFEALGEITPQKVRALKPPQLKETGLSMRKVEYIKDLADKFSSGQVSEEKLNALGDEEVMQLLIGVRGIGPWTAEMFLMFSLGRLDIFSPDDLGLKRAMEELYSDGKPLTRSQLVEIAERWTPYRSIACQYLWKWRDGKK